MKIKVSEASGPVLDWMVAKCEGLPLIHTGRMWPTDGADTIQYAPWSVHRVEGSAGPYVPSLCRQEFAPSTDWAQGGPLVEREKISVIHYEGIKAWVGIKSLHPEEVGLEGPTPLIAAMRCFVVSKLGDEVEVPDELVNGGA